MWTLYGNEMAYESVARGGFIKCRRIRVCSRHLQWSSLISRRSSSSSSSARARRWGDSARREHYRDALQPRLEHRKRLRLRHQHQYAEERALQLHGVRRARTRLQQVQAQICTAPNVCIQSTVIQWVHENKGSTVCVNEAKSKKSLTLITYCIL